MKSVDLRILLVKLSSLGDVVHTLPVVQDIRGVLPGAQIDWVVERAFAPLVRRADGIGQVIEADLRNWRRAPLSGATRAAWRMFRQQLKNSAYDAVIDLQGLTKSALVAKMAHLTPGGHRYALGNRTDGAGWEPATRWVSDTPIMMPKRIHALTRSRQLCSQALGYPMPAQIHYGLRVAPADGVEAGTVAILHGTSRDDKEWPDDHWFELGNRLMQQGHRLSLVHGNAAEEARSGRMADAWKNAGQGAMVSIWPRMALDALADHLAACAGAVGVDTGLSHLAVALDLAHVQIYRHPTAWRTGPIGSERQLSVGDDATPSVDEVWNAWLSASQAAHAPTALEVLA